MRGAILAAATVVSALAQPSPIELVRIAGGLDQPVYLTSAGDGSGRLFVVEQRGRIRILNNGAIAATPFLDIAPRVSCCGERGLLSVAFPPGYAEKKYFYVYYTALNGDITVSRFRLGASGAGDPASETILLSIAHREFGNHNGGLALFGPDGYLYVGTGDGGGGGDTLGNGQNTGALLGKLLRIDTENSPTYRVPADNPFVSRLGYRPEIWAYGLRNPWRFSFDRETRDLYIGDVGQGQYEEVDFQPASSRGGENYGWNRMEGAHCYQPGCSTSGLVLPVAEYPHAGGDCSVTGGFVYRGSRVPSLAGAYLYGDYCTGRLWSLRRGSPSTLLLDTSLLISSFGEDEAGELYVVDHAGSIYLLTGGAPSLSREGVVNSASYEPGLVPGSNAAIFGTGLTNASGIVAAGVFPLPTTLAQTGVTIKGAAVPLLAVARLNGVEQINIQVPWELAGSGTASVRVTNLGVESAPVVVEMLTSQPGVYTSDGVRAVAQHADYSPVTQSAPARKNRVIVLWANGLGPVDRPPATGAPAPSTPPARTVATPLVTIGGATATVEFCGLAPTTAGQYQLNVVVPPGAPSGDQEVIIIAVGGRASKPARIWVE